MSEPWNADPEKTYALVALINAIRFIVTKRGQRMAVLTVEDYNGSLEAVCFSETLQQYEAMIAMDAIIGIQGKVDSKRGSPQIVVEAIMPPDEMVETEGGELHIRLKPGCRNDIHALQQLRGDIFGNTGSCPVFLHVPAEDSDQGPFLIVQAGLGLTSSNREEKMAELRKNKMVAEVWRTYPAMQVRSEAREDLDMEEVEDHWTVADFVP